jgi:DNA-binding beta-propeller fold protein YncE
MRRVIAVKDAGQRSRRGLLATVVAALALGTVLVAPTPAGATITQTFTGSVDAGSAPWKQHLFEVVDDGQIQATLNWDNSAANLNLFLYRKNANGTWTLVAQAATSNRPEQITYPTGTVGTWKVGVKAISGATAYSVTVSHSPDAPPPPSSIATYSETFGFNGPAGNYAYGGDWDPSTNTILWGDYWNYRVKRYTTSGEKCTPALCDGSPFVVTVTKSAGQLGGSTAPYDVETDMSDLDGSGRASFWVSDQGSSRIVQYSNTGAWLQTIGLGGGGTGGAHPGHQYAVGCGAGKMTIPTHMWVDPNGGRLFVSDPRCRNVYAFTHTGVFEFQFNWTGWKTLTGLGTPIPRGIAEGRDWDGNGQRDIYVVEHNSRRVVVFNKLGQYLGAFPRVDQMNDPRGLDVDPVSGRVVTVSAYKNRVYVFSPSGSLLQWWGDMDGPGSSAMGDRLFDSIRFPAVDGAGNIYVGDTWGFREPDPRTGTNWFGYRVYKFNPSYAPLSWTTLSEPPPNGGYNQNNGVAVSPAGALFVVDTFEQRVQKFDTSSHCRTQLSCPGWLLQFGSREPAGTGSKGFGYPRTLTFGSGKVWVGDNNNAVLAWTADGTFVHRFGSQGSSPGKFLGGVQGILVPGNGKVYTTDVGNCRLQVFDENAALSQSNPPPLTHMGSCGGGAGQMNGPRGIEVSPNGNTAYVVETWNNRISIWNLTAKTATTAKPSCGGKALKSPWGITWDPSNTWLYVGDLGNSRVVRWSPSSPSTCQVVTTGSDAPQAFKGPNYLAFGPDGRLYVSDNTGHVYAFTING